jgi:hypothetical protein
MSRDEHTIDFPGVEAIAATDLALLIAFDVDDQGWVPQSQISDDSEVYEKGHVGTLVVSYWWAEKAGRAHRAPYFET